MNSSVNRQGQLLTSKQRKGTNRILNGIKNNIQTVGNQVIHEEDVKMNDSGVLVGIIVSVLIDVFFAIAPG